MRQSHLTSCLISKYCLMFHRQVSTNSKPILNNSKKLKNGEYDFFCIGSLTWLNYVPPSNVVPVGPSRLVCCFCAMKYLSIVSYYLVTFHIKV